MRIRFWKREKKKVGKTPEAWVTLPKATETVKTQKTTFPSMPHISFPRKIHVPHLLMVKRILAFFLLVANFFIAQAALTSAPASQPLYLLFFLNALIFLDYLWKTRRITIEKERWKAY